MAESTAEQQTQEQLELERAAPQVDLEEGEQNKPGELERMGVMFFAILLILCIIADFVDMLTAGTIGWIVGLFVDGILLIATGLTKAGRKQFKRIVASVIGEKVPILNILPLRSFFLIWSFVKSRQEPPTQLGLSEYQYTELGEYNEQ